MWSDTCSAESPMGKSFESLASYASATFYVLMEVARSVGTTLRAAIATTIFVDQGSDCGAGGIRRNECKTLMRLNRMRQSKEASNMPPHETSVNTTSTLPSPS